MEFAAALPRPPLLASSPPLNLHRRLPQPLSLSFTKTRCFKDLNPSSFTHPLSFSFSGRMLPSPPPSSPASHVARISAASSGSGGNGDDLGASGGGGGGGDGGSSGGETEVKSFTGVSDEVVAMGSDDIILSVGGMSCGGCAASVKRILESQPQVSSATVNLEKETAVVSVVPEVKASQNWQHQLGEMLADHLTTCGFKSILQVNY